MKTRRVVSNRRRRGATITEISIGAGISTMVLIAGVGTFFLGMRSWVKGQTAIDTLGASQMAVRNVSDELREAMEVTVTTDGKECAYKLPARSTDGAFVSPLAYDGIARKFSVTSSGDLRKYVGSNYRTIARGLTTQQASDTIRFFTSGTATVSRSVTVDFIAKKPSFRGEYISNRARETVYLRNVPQLSR